MSNNAVFLKKQVKDLQAQLEDKDVQMREVVRLLGVLLDNRSIDPVLLGIFLRLLSHLPPAPLHSTITITDIPGDKIPKLDAGFVASLPADIIAALELQLALTDANHRKTSTSHSSSNSSEPKPKTRLPSGCITPFKPRDSRVPLSESRTQNLKTQPTPIRSIEDVLGGTMPKTTGTHKSGTKTKTRSGMKKESGSEIRRKSKSKSRGGKVYVGESITKAARTRSIRGQ
jgi:hypothetical protein